MALLQSHNLFSFTPTRLDPSETEPHLYKCKLQGTLSLPSKGHYLKGKSTAVMDTVKKTDRGILQSSKAQGGAGYALKESYLFIL